jgi:hypothetical protein
MSLITGKMPWLQKVTKTTKALVRLAEATPIRVIRAIRGQSPLFRVIPCGSVVPPRPRFVCFVLFRGQPLSLSCGCGFAALGHPRSNPVFRGAPELNRSKKTLKILFQTAG